MPGHVLRRRPDCPVVWQPQVQLRHYGPCPHPVLHLHRVRPAGVFPRAFQHGAHRYLPDHRGGDQGRHRRGAGLCYHPERGSGAGSLGRGGRHCGRVCQRRLGGHLPAGLQILPGPPRQAPALGGRAAPHHPSGNAGEFGAVCGAHHHWLLLFEPAGHSGRRHFASAAARGRRAFPGDGRLVERHLGPRPQVL